MTIQGKLKYVRMDKDCFVFRERSTNWDTTWYLMWHLNKKIIAKPRYSLHYHTEVDVLRQLAYSIPLCDYTKGLLLEHPVALIIRRSGLYVEI